MSNGTVVLETERLILREITEDDAAFVLEILNSPKFLKYIGDRGVRTLDDARRFVREKFWAGYESNGYGLYLVELKGDVPRTPIGECGFVRRDTLPGPDLGFAFLPEFERQGYGLESAEAVMNHGRETLGFTDVYAITSLDNDASIGLLERLGFSFEKEIESGDERLKRFISRSSG